jgi:hypothetical protein
MTNNQAQPAREAEEPVIWAIFDSQGFYETREFQVEAQAFCDFYNKREWNNPLKPYRVVPLYATPPSQSAHPDLRELEQAARKALEALEECKTGGYRDIDGDWCTRQVFNQQKAKTAISALRSALGQEGEATNGGSE